MKEESGEPFACPTGTEAHTCDHDFHAAMLLGAAKMLKENEDKLEGTVKFMFQPGEETMDGARNMLENGVMENPAPDAALAPPSKGRRVLVQIGAICLTVSVACYGLALSTLITLILEALDAMGYVGVFPSFDSFCCYRSRNAV